MYETYEMLALSTIAFVVGYLWRHREYRRKLNYGSYLFSTVATMAWLLLPENKEKINGREQLAYEALRKTFKEVGFGGAIVQALPSPTDDNESSKL